MECFSDQAIDLDVVLPDEHRPYALVVWKGTSLMKLMHAMLNHRFQNDECEEMYNDNYVMHDATDSRALDNNLKVYQLDFHDRAPRLWIHKREKRKKRKQKRKKQQRKKRRRLERLMAMTEKQTKMVW